MRPSMLCFDASNTLLSDEHFWGLVDIDKASCLNEVRFIYNDHGNEYGFCDPR